MLALVSVYTVSIVMLSLALIAGGLDSFAAVLATLDNTGPGLGMAGPSTPYAILSDLQTWACTFSMPPGGSICSPCSAPPSGASEPGRRGRARAGYNRGVCQESAMSTHPSSVADTLDHLSRFAPFDGMERAHLEWLAERLTLRRYARGEAVVSPSGGPADTFHVIRQGVIHGEQDVVRAQDNTGWLELHEGECFPLGALLSGGGVASTYRAGPDSECYTLGAADFHALMGLSAAFRAFCTRRVASLLEQSKRVIQGQSARAASEQQSMTSPLSAIIGRLPESCAPDTPLREVLARMDRLGIGSMVAVDAAGRPVGIFTLHDVLSRVVLPERGLDEPLSAVMSPEPFTLPPHALACEAALAMARHGFRHILVEEHGRLAGLVSEKDLFAVQRVGLRQVSATIRNAERLDALRQSAGDIRRLARNLQTQGVAAEQLTQIISTLNDMLTRRVIELELGDSPAAEVEFCWLALGSEGRFEQTLNTDQDNGIVFAPRAGQDADATRAELLPFARRVNEALAECGFPLCKGEVMAMNPNWCLSLEEWQRIFGEWIFRGDAPVLLNASIFFDFRALAGDARLADALRGWLNQRARDNRQFLRLLTQNALGNRPPLGLVRDFVLDDDPAHPHTLDLKLHGTTPFVDAARIFALAAGLADTGTAARLRGAGAAWKLKASEVASWVEAFHFIQHLRLRLHHQQLDRELPLSNRLDPDDLAPLERGTLKEAFRQAKRLQSTLESYFQF